MKKLLLPLILILSVYILVGYCATFTSQYPLAQSDTYVKATTHYSNRDPYYATDPTKSLTGPVDYNAWVSLTNELTEQRFHIDLGSEKVIKRIYYENHHYTGSDTNRGVQNFTFWGSNAEASFLELTYGTDTGWTGLTVGNNNKFDEHSVADEADPKYITVTNSTGYRYYAFKFADSYGGADYMGVRRIELQTEDEVEVTWLAGWDYRIELAIADYAGDIGGIVTWFPVEVFLTATQAEEVFAELTTDAEYKKMQFTQADGTSLLYGHMKLFDVSEELGIFTVSATGWTINANTSVWLYYDKENVDNDTYIGATNTSACEAVYNPQYIAVYTMADGVDNAHIYDATDNDNDGTKKDADEPIETAGKVGRGQNFAGDDDIISMTDNAGWDTGGAVTLETVFKTSVQQNSKGMIVHDISNYKYMLHLTGASGRILFFIVSASGSSFADNLESAGYYSDGVFRYIAAVYDKTLGSDRLVLYRNGASVATANGYNQDITAGDEGLTLGQYTTNYCNFIQDVVRISNSARSAAWIEGTYNSIWDTLFTYGSEEEAPVVGITWNGALIKKWNGITITIPINTQ